MKPTSPSRFSAFDIVLLLFAAVLLFSTLDGSLLWDDEADTALLGRNILKFGLPLAYDGKNIVSSELGREFGADFVYRWSSWGDKYTAALSMYLFGETTAGARLLFVVAAFASVFVFHIVARRLFSARWEASLATAFYSLGIPFILHARQCRYYALVFLMSTLSLHLLLRPVRTRRHWAGFIAVSLLFFHANYMLAIAFLSALSCTVLAVRVKRRFSMKEFAVGIGAALAVSLPGLLLYSAGGASGLPFGSSFFSNLSFYLVEINDYLYPVLLALALAAALILKGWRADGPPEGPTSRRGLLALGIAFSSFYLAILAFAPFSFLRYLTPLFPVFALLLAASVSIIARRSLLAALAISSVLLLTNIVHAVPRYALGAGKRPAVRSMLYEHARELVYPVRGPIRGMVEYLRQNAGEHDVVLITYGDLPLKFYTGLEVHGGLTGEDLGSLDLDRIKWIIARKHIVTMEPGRDYSVHQFIERSFSPDDFTRIELDVPDTPFENREDPGLHIFKTPAGVPNVTIFRRKDAP